MSYKFKLTLTILRLVARLPFGALYGLSDVCRPILQHVVRYRRKVVRKNLKRAYPEKSVAERREIERRFYGHLCDLAVEIVKLLHVSPEEMRRRVEVRDAGLVEQAAHDGQSVVLLLGHYGNWEWAQEASRYYRMPQLTGEIYHPLSSPVAEAIMHRIRSRYSTLLIPQKKALRTLLGLHAERTRCIVAFISDQRPRRSSLNHWTAFLRQDTPFMSGAEDIGRHTESRFLYLDIKKPSRGHYILTFRELHPEPDGRPYPCMRRYLKMLESTIDHAPEYWLWSHDLWKLNRPQRLRLKDKQAEKALPTLTNEPNDIMQ